MDIDTLSHSTTLCKKIIQSLNINSLCKYDNLHKAYLLEYSNKPINSSYILVFLKQLACYTVTPDTHYWYRINNNGVTDNHNIAIFNDTTINMVPLPPAEPSEFNAFETVVRLSLSQNQRDLPNDIQTQAIPSTSITTDNDKGNIPQNNTTQSCNQSTVIVQLFSIITEELKNSTNKVSSDITKITQAYNTAQENTGQTHRKCNITSTTNAQSTTTPSTPVNTRNCGTNYTNPSYETSWISAWLTSNHAM